MLETKDPNELGALWSKTSNRGEYFTGTVNGEPVVIFPNTKKVAGSKQPDWRVFRPKQKEVVPTPPATGTIDDSDVPF